MLQEAGYIGLFIGSFLASTIVPFSADALFVGCIAIHLNVFLCLLLATLGNWLGGLTSYYIGRLGNMDKIERWAKVSREKLEKQQHIVAKWGALLAFITWLPIVGDVFAISLGFYKISFPKSACWMLLGRALRFAVLLVLWQKWGVLLFSI
ncbi:MAG: DedA family protein [Bacteroidales bacterium]|nr:DedA family protein [Bacteroidales bacterium]